MITDHGFPLSLSPGATYDYSEAGPDEELPGTGGMKKRDLQTLESYVNRIHDYAHEWEQYHRNPGPLYGGHDHVRLYDHEMPNKEANRKLLPPTSQKSLERHMTTEHGFDLRLSPQFYEEAQPDQQLPAAGGLKKRELPTYESYLKRIHDYTHEYPEYFAGDPGFHEHAEIPLGNKEASKRLPRPTVDDLMRHLEVSHGKRGNWILDIDPDDREAPGLLDVSHQCLHNPNFSLQPPDHEHVETHLLQPIFDENLRIIPDALPPGEAMPERYRDQG